MSERVLELRPRPASRLTGRELLASIDRRQQENRSRSTWALGLPPRAWWLDPRYG